MTKTHVVEIEILLSIFLSRTADAVKDFPWQRSSFSADFFAIFLENFEPLIWDFPGKFFSHFVFRNYYPVLLVSEMEVSITKSASFTPLASWEEFKKFEEFKSEIEENKLGSDMAEARQLEQISALHEKAETPTSYGEKQRRYLSKRSSLPRQLVAPLGSFYCPITLDVMVDPVEISSSRTFERSAVERWFADGNRYCPVTSSPLNDLVLRPNRNLRQSIEEWREMNNMITIVSIKPKLQSSEEQEVIQSLQKLHDLCTEHELNRELVSLEDYIPILVGLLYAKSRETRTLALAILYILAKDSHDNTERIAKVDNVLQPIVRSLARQIGESKLALQLLLQLSRCKEVREVIGTIQGSILLLVSLLNSDDSQASGDAKELLDNLSFLHQNVIDMAKANYFKPLLQLLSSGPDNVRMIMADTLSEIKLTDHGKLSLFKDGALEPLLKLLSHDDLEMKGVAVKALQNLSSLPEYGLLMIREGALGPLFEILYRHSLSSPSMREQVAVIIMNLAISTNVQESDHEQVSLLESDEDVFKLFSLISLTGPDIQRCILQAFHAICQSSSGSNIRTMLRQLSAVQVLVQLCELRNHVEVRASAVKLFHCLTEDGDNTVFQEHVDERCIGTLLRIIKTSDDEEEIAAAMGIVSNLPLDSEKTQCLLDAGALDIICTFLSDGNINSRHRQQVSENAVKALCRFTVSTNQEWQKRVAKAGFIPLLVRLLISGTPLTKKSAAISIKQFSESSTALSKPIKHGTIWCCLAAPQRGCPVHMGICTVDSSFCILEANALEPLLRILSENDVEAAEASLDAINTLIDGEKLQSGCKLFAERDAIPPIIKLLSSSSAHLQEKALLVLERIFRLVEMKQMYAQSAEMPLVDITQRGTSGMKSLAARVLAHLNVLGEQSSFF
ncbi:hypothetical protein SLE2022_374450 [Rubroshorea leprosula]